MEEAEKILSEKGVLPQQIESAPTFYVADSEDDTVLAFGTIQYEGKTFKIGTRTLN